MEDSSLRIDSISLTLDSGALVKIRLQLVWVMKELNACMNTSSICPRHLPNSMAATHCSIRWSNQRHRSSVQDTDKGYILPTSPNPLYPTVLDPSKLNPSNIIASERPPHLPTCLIIIRDRERE